MLLRTRDALRRGRWNRPVLLATLFTLVVLGVWGVWQWGYPRFPPPPPDPRLTFDTPFQNVRPEVRYVGDEACAGCHGKIAESYRNHPMGRSLAPVGRIAATERQDEAARHSFTHAGTEYRIERDGDRIVHRVRRKAADGRSLFEIEAEAAYVIGSGTRGRSYLVERDGCLFQSPISWYSQKEIWDLSPGYSPDRLFDRPIPSNCLYCHANDAALTPGTVNRYEKPIFRQHAIGCERCHGPGELHVAHQNRGATAAGRDTTIVNPKHLEPRLREAVCQQCHLQGQVSVDRRGRSRFEYRPGLPLDLFVSVFVRIPKLAEEYKAVGHVEQMRVSRCFQASQGKLGCVSCHDPHGVPEETKRITFYRDRCLACHTDQSCSLEPAVRRQTHSDDSCMACHMQRALSSDIAHTAVTDHRIRRKPPPDSSQSGPPPALAPGESPLVAFPGNGGEPLDPDRSRDLGIALVQIAREQRASARFLLPQAEPRLTTAVQTDPGDLASREALAHVHWSQGRAEEALTDYAQLLRDFPNRETALVDATLLALQVNRSEEAVRYARRLLEVNPENPVHHQYLALALAGTEQWEEAETSCREALRRSPARREVWQLLIRCLLGSGNRTQAETELETLIALDPVRGGELRRWFAELSR